MVYEQDLNFLEDDIDLDSPLDDLDTLAVLDANPKGVLRKLQRS